MWTKLLAFIKNLVDSRSTLSSMRITMLMGTTTICTCVIAVTTVFCILLYKHQVSGTEASIFVASLTSLAGVLVWGKNAQNKTENQQNGTPTDKPNG